MGNLCSCCKHTDGVPSKTSNKKYGSNDVTTAHGHYEHMDDHGSNIHSNEKKYMVGKKNNEDMSKSSCDFYKFDPIHIDLYDEDNEVVNVTRAKLVTTRPIPVSDN